MMDILLTECLKAKRLNTIDKCEEVIETITTSPPVLEPEIEEEIITIVEKDLPECECKARVEDCLGKNVNDCCCVCCPCCPEK